MDGYTINDDITHNIQRWANNRSFLRQSLSWL